MTTKTSGTVAWRWCWLVLAASCSAKSASSPAGAEREDAGALDASAGLVDADVADDAAVDAACAPFEGLREFDRDAGCFRDGAPPPGALCVEYPRGKGVYELCAFSPAHVMYATGTASPQLRAAPGWTFAPDISAAAFRVPLASPADRAACGLVKGSWEPDAGSPACP